nr:unnamed protein product [Callosobruchus chinensis]
MCIRNVINTIGNSHWQTSKVLAIVITKSDCICPKIYIFLYRANSKCAYTSTRSVSTSTYLYYFHEGLSS